MFKARKDRAAAEAAWERVQNLLSRPGASRPLEALIEREIAHAEEQAR